MLIFSVSGSYSAHAMISVYDAINTAENIVQQVVDRVVQAAQHAEDMAKYVQMIENQTLTESMLELLEDAVVSGRVRVCLDRGRKAPATSLLSRATTAARPVEQPTA